jgi:diguanylate cyclase (GGDEF)-like protein
MQDFCASTSMACCLHTVQIRSTTRNMPPVAHSPAVMPVRGRAWFLCRCFQRVGVLSLIVMLSVAPALAAAPSSPNDIPVRALNTVMVHNYDVDDGLPQNTVHAIAQTRDGYLWVATWEGVARFNGRAFKVFDPGSEPELSAGGVRSLLADVDGGLWLGQSENGVTRELNGQFRAGIRNEDVSADQVLALVADSSGRIYAGTADHGVQVLDHGMVRQLGEAGSRVLGMVFDSQQRLLLATHRGLQRIEPGTDAMQRFGGGQTRALAVNGAGRVLVGGDEGLHELLDEQLRGIELPASLKSASITAMVVDREARLWFGTQSEGLFRATFAGDGRIALVEKLGIAEGLPNLRVLSLAFDREGSLWVGSNGGLSQVVETGIARFGPAQGLDNPFARTLAESPNGDIFIGTSGGLYQYRDGHLISRLDAAELGSSSVTALLFGSDGDLWVGTYDAGVSRVRDGRVIERLDRRKGLHQLSIRTLLFDPDGSLWIGTSEGLVHYVDGKGELVDLFPKPSPDFILSLALAPDQSLWIGTAIGLARRSADGQVRVFDKHSGYPALDTFDIQFEDDGHAWLATDAGLLRMRGDRFQVLGRAQGMPSDTLFRLLIDQSGAFWLSSNRGLARIDRGAIDAVLAAETTKVEPVLLTADNGMSATQCNGGTQAAGIRAVDGSLWIPTSNGVSHIQPSSFPAPPRPPVPLGIEGVSVDGLAAELPLQVPAGARRVEFDLAGLAFASTGELRFRHWLEGFDSGYGAPVRQASIGYTNLPPGHYVLHTLARMGASGDIGPSLDLPFDVSATWLQTRWVQALLIAAVLLLMIAIYTSRIATLRRNERRLEAMVDARTLELQERATALNAANHEKNRLLEQLSHQALHDSLTGLPNRLHADRHLLERFAAAHGTQGRLFIAIMDVDHFKRINDEHSHQAGDQVLIALAAHMRDCEGLWCARIGGEEFLLVSERSRGESVALFERLRCDIANAPITRFKDVPITITISIGWVEATEFAYVDKALAEADRRLYEAKGAGRNRVKPMS